MVIQWLRSALDVQSWCRQGSYGLSYYSTVLQYLAFHRLSEKSGFNYFPKMITESIEWNRID